MADARFAVDIVLPGLFSHACAGLPALEELLARANRRAEPASLPVLMFSLFGHAPASDLPVAAVGLLGAGSGAEGEWLRADPVQFVPARDHVLITPTSPLDASEVALLAAELGRHFGWQVQVASGHLHVRLPAPPGIALPAPDAALGRSLGSVLPHDRAHLAWLSLINEIQMLLHGSAVNRAREERGLEPVNGLWLWGAGPLPASRPMPFGAVWGGDGLVRGLTRLGGSEPQVLPEQARTVFEAAQGRQLVVFPETVDDLPLLEANWFKPLLIALRPGPLSLLTLHGVDGRAYEVSRPGLRRFWRRRRTLESYRP